jgi:hypothetical protein
MLLSDDHRGATTGDRWQHNTTAARPRRQCQDEVRIVEQCCGGSEFGVAEGPFRRPFLPQLSGKFAAVGLQPSAAALAMSVRSTKESNLRFFSA